MCIRDSAVVTQAGRLSLELARAQGRQTADYLDEAREEIEEGLRDIESDTQLWSEELDTYDLEPKTGNYDPRIDQETGLPKPKYWKHLKSTTKGRRKLRELGIDPDAPVGGWPGGIDPRIAERERIAEIERRNDEIREANARVESGEIYGTVPYPQYDPSKDPNRNRPTETVPEFVGVVAGAGAAEQAAEEAERVRRAEIAADLADYQDRYLDAKRAEEVRKEAERQARIKDGTLDIQPVEFDPPTWTPPSFTPPTWTPPEFDAPEFDPPEISEIEFTQFDGSENWIGGAGNLAYQYGDLSGTVATDTSKYDEWIASVGRHKLEQLALTAGYPNLASALADWKNLTRQANDDGYRQWAQRAPVCYLACAGLHGQWQLKASQLALGDILNESRDIFSTAGLSDISISGFLLNYLLRDFGLEDGDNINVTISQFGREIFTQDLSLLNAGTEFNINLRPGVASVVITALDEGAISPNTAEITLENVIEGDAVQTYSLLTGEQAVLRVEPGR